jgi:hypothetical protein
VLSPDIPLTIIDVIEMAMRIFPIIDYQGTAKAIAVLVPEVAVVPECALCVMSDKSNETV